MNKVYRLVWSALLGAWVCVAETARARGKTRGVTLRAAALLLAGPGFALAAPPVSIAPTALPTGGQVVAGQASIQQNAPAALTIQQGTQRAAIDWQSFNIGAAASVNFVQPSSQSVTLNRVLDGNPSQIFGKLSANGQVYLTNPSGVYFAPGASVEVGGLVATTHSLGNADFMAGLDSFDRLGSKGSVINLGRLAAAPGGYIALLAPEVRNEGVIVANAGTVALAAGEKITLDFGPDAQLAGITVTPAQIKTLVENRHAIVTDGGQIILAARSAEGLMGSVINSGMLNATSLVNRGGVIMMEGDDISLSASSQVEAKGPSGGGTVLIGGGPQGGGAMHQATQVTMAEGATIDASATGLGNGGTVVLFTKLHDSDARTEVHGSIVASGGAQGGHGGLVETSGASVDFKGLRVDTRATLGSTGTWLTDPYDLTVDASSASTINTNLSSTNVTLQTTSSGTSGPGVANASGSGDITISSAISWSTANTLTLDAYRSVAINAAVTASGAGKVIIKTNDGGSGGDYSFGATSVQGGAGSLSFTGTAGSGQTLTINGSAFTLLYDFSAGATGFKSLNGKTSGNYALAKPLDAVALGLGTQTTSLNATFGNSSTHTAVFTGLGNAITNLTINVAASTSNVGVFGTNFAVVRDFGVSGTLTQANASTGNFGLLAGYNSAGTLQNVYTTGSVSNNPAGGTNGILGGLVGSSGTSTGSDTTGGSIINAYSTATVTNRDQSTGGLVGFLASGTISNSHATGNVTSTLSFYTGGLVGKMGTSGVAGAAITNSYATGVVTSPREYEGGLVGFVGGGTVGSPNIISGSYATGAVNGQNTNVGGLIGVAGGYTNVSNSYATGNVTGTGAGATAYGGLIGATGGNEVDISNSYATGNVSIPTTTGTSAGGLIGDATATILTTSFATGAVSGNGYVGGLIGVLRGPHAPYGISDVYATGTVSGNNNAGGLIGGGGCDNFNCTVTNAYASGQVTAIGASPSAVGGFIGSGSTLQVINGYWDSTKDAQGYGVLPSTINGASGYTTANAPGGMSTATLQNGSYPNGFSPSTWGVLSGVTPYFLYSPPAAAANYQIFTGTAYTTGGSTGANAAVINLYMTGSLLGTTTTNSTGAWSFSVPVGTVSATTPLGETMALSGAPSTVVGASYADTRVLSSGNFSGFDVTQGLFDFYTSNTTLSGLNSAATAAFGSSTYSNATSALSAGGKQYRATGSFNADTAPSAGGNLKLQSLGGDLTISAPFTWSSANTLTLDAYRNVNINAAINVSGTGGNGGKVVLVTGDTGNTGKSASATGDYYFGLSNTTFAGSLDFTGGSGSGATLSIGTGGDNIAPTAYTLLYSLATALSASGKYALATSITDSGTRTASVYASNNGITYTGLGHTVSSLNIATTSGTTGFFGTLAGAGVVIRDIGVSGTVGSSGASAVGGLIGTTAASTIKDTFSTANITGHGAGGASSTGGLIGSATNTTSITNSTATGTVSGNVDVGGLVGYMNGNSGSVVNSHTTGAVTASGSTIGGLIGLMSGTGTSVANSYATGDVTITSGGTSYAGGLIGQLSGGTAPLPNAVTNSYATGNATAQTSNAAGLVGIASSVTVISNAYATGSATGSTGSIGGLVGSAAGALTINSSYAIGNALSTGAAGTGIGGLVGVSGSGLLTINTSFATGSASGAQRVGGLVGSIQNGGATVNDAYANGDVTGTQSGSGSIGGLFGTNVGAATATNVYASGKVSNTGAASVGALIGVNGANFTITNGYWDSTKSSSASALGSTTGGTATFNFNPAGPGTGALSTATLTNGSLPSGFNTAASINSSPWNVVSGFYPYFTYQFPAGAQAISGHGYLTGGSSAAVSASIKLYANGAYLGMGTTNGTGAYTALVNSGSVTASTPLGGTLTLSGGASIVGATFTDSPTLVSGSVTGFDITQGLFTVKTSTTTDSTLQANLLTQLPGTFGSGNWTSINSALTGASATEKIISSGAFTVDDALSYAGGVSISAGGTLTVSSSGSVTSSGGNVTLASTAGDVVVNAPTTFATGNTLTYDASGNVIIDAPVTVSSTGKVVIVSGDTGNNGVGTAAGDYSFGLTANGFLGALNFTNTPGAGQTLTINNAAYTLLYTQANLAGVNGGTGKYALANTLDLSSAGTLTASLVGSLGSGSVFTGLGHTVNNMTLSATAAGFVGLIGTSNGTLRDVGVMGGSVTGLAGGNSAVGGLIGYQPGGSVKNVFATNNVNGSLSGISNTNTGGLIGVISGGGTVSNAFATGAVTSSSTGGSTAGFVGYINNGTISNAFATGAVTNTASGGSASGFVGWCDGCTITNAYATGAARTSNSTASGFIAGASSASLSSVYSTGLVIGSTTGGLSSSSTPTITNGYYNGGTTGQSDTGHGLSQTTAQLQSGSLPTGFSSSLWSTGSGIYPYLTQFYPNGVHAISGTTYTAAGDAASASTINLYAGGAATSVLSPVLSGANGYYYAITPTGTLPAAASTMLAGTQMLSGAGAVSGASYTDTPTTSNGNITGFDLKSGLFLATTAKTSLSALNTDLSNTFGSGTNTSVATAMAAAFRQINASGAFTVDTALSQAGGLGLDALSGNLTLNAATSAGSGALILQSSGNITQGASGNVSAANLLLLGGNVTLNNSGNNVSTLAASGISGLSYRDADALTIDSIGPVNTGMLASNINGAVSTVSGIAASSAVTLNSGGDLTLNTAVTATNSDITLQATGNVTEGVGGSGSVVGNSLLLLGGNVTMNSNSNNVATLAASGVSGLAYLDSNSVTIGTVGATSGVSATGIVDIAARFGNLTVAQNVATTNASSAAISLNAGQGYTPGTASGGNLLISGSPAVTTGAGGRATLYSGSATANTTLATFIGQGSGRFRYNSDENTSNFTTALGTGLYGVYRQAINTAIAANSQSVVYGTAPAALTASTALVNGDSATLAITSPQTSTSGNYKVGSYSIDASNLAALVGLGYTAFGNSGTLTVTPKTLTLSGITAVSRAYNGSNVAALDFSGASYGGLVSGDVISAATSTATFSDKNVGTGKTVTLANLLSGADAGNYSIASSSTTTANITQAALSLSTANVSKIYDGNTSATGAALSVLSGTLFGTDALSGGTFAFSNKNVGAGNKTVNVSGATVNDGSSGANYSISYVANTTSTITPKALSVSGLAVNNRIYNGTAVASVITTGAAFAGLVGGDALTVSATGSFANKNVGLGKTVTLSSSYGGADAGNYTITDQASTTADIMAATLVISTGNVSKVYDGTTSVSGGAAIASSGTLYGSDSLSGGSFLYNNKDVGAGTKVVSVSGVTVNDGNSGANYNVSYANNTASTITAKGLTISGITAANKVYDGTTAATVSTGAAVYTGLIGGDAVSVSATGSFANKNVANGKTVILANVIGGADAGNYAITNQASATANITPKTLTVSQLSVADRAYNGTAMANVVTGSAQFTGLVTGDSFAINSSTGSFANKNVGTGKTATLTTTYSGSDVNNYTVVDQASTTASITAAPLTVGTVDVTKVYDGTTTVFGGSAVAASGTLFSGDTLTGGTFAYTSKNVGVGNKVVVDVIGATLNDGNSGNNYNVSYIDNTNSTITPKGLTISGITAANKVYDGATAATVNTGGAVYTGLVGGDAVSVSTTGSFANKNVANGKTVTLANVIGGADAGNYTITNQASTTANITPKTLTVSELTVADRSYNGTAVASVVTGSAQFTGLVAGDSFAISSSTGSFANKNVGAGKTVTLTTSYSGADTGNYTVVDQASTTASITQALLTLSTSNVSKTYDGTTSVTGGSAVVTGGTLFGGDSLSGGTFAYTDKNAGVSSKVVNVSGVTVNDGNSGGNYIVSYASNTDSTINKAALTISGITAADKTYDGTTNATVSTASAVYGGLIGGDAVSVAATGTFANANAGAGKTVSLSSNYSGADAGNYTITNQASTTASIGQANLLVTANADARFVTQSDSAGYNGVHYDGFVGGDTETALTLGGLSIARPNAGTDVSAGVYSGALVPSGVSSTNYAISYAPGTYTILAAQNALVKVVNVNAGYSTTPSYAITSVEYMNGSNVISPLSLIGSTGNSFSYSDGAGGSLNFVLNPAGAVISGAGKVAVGNYAIQDASPSIIGGNLIGPVTFTGNLAVQAKAASASASGVSKVYDGTTAMSGVTLNLAGQVGGDQLTVGGNGNFSQKDVGSNLSYSVSGLSLGGADAANYYLSGGGSLSGSNGAITPKAIAIGGITVATKIYDGSTAATVDTSTATYSGLINGDDVAVDATGVFANKNAGTGKTVTLTSNYSGADIGNYSFTDQATALGNITPKALSVSGLAVANRVFDGTSVAAVDISGANYAGLIGGDAVQVAATGTYANKNVGVNKTVTLSSNYSGADAGNYTITSQATTVGDITPALITVSTSNVSKVYDGGMSVSGGAAVLTSGSLFGSDALSGGTFSYSDKNVGSGNKTVFVSGVGVSDGNSGSNYTVSYADNTSSSITPKSLTISGITAADKVYDGTLSAAPNTGAAVYTGLVGGDDVAVVATGVFGDKNVGNGKTITLTSNYSGADIGNYSFTNQASTTGNITPKALSVSGLAVANRVYDGSILATVDISGANYAGLIGGDAVQVAATGTYADKNVGANKTVTLSSNYSGADIGNYTIASQASTTGDITPKAVTLSGITAGNKVYNGTTAASVSTGAAVIAGLVNGDAVTVSATGLFDSKDVGNAKTVLLSSSYGGGDVGNYSFTDQLAASANVTPKTLTIGGISAADKVYDGGLSAITNAGAATFGGLVGGDDVHVLSSSGSFIDKNVGSGKTVSLSNAFGGTDIGNYAVVDQASASANITPRALVVSELTVSDRSYNGSTVASVVTGAAQFTGLVVGDSFGIASASGSFGDKNVGNNKAVSLVTSYNGADAGNYSVTDQTGTTASITPAALAVSVHDVSKIYDGSTNVSGGTAFAVGTLFGADSLSGGSFAYANKNVGNGDKTVTVGGVTVSDGNGGGNYTVSYLDNTSSTITPKALTVSGITAAGRTYDGTTAASVDATGASFGGLIGGDVVTVAATGAFANKNAGIGKTVNLSSSYGGADAFNYAIADQASTTATITPASLTVSTSNVSKVYDGNTSVSGAAPVAVAGTLFSGDSLSGGSYAYTDKNAGTANKTVTVGGVNVNDGNSGGNYSVSYADNTSSSITPKTLTISGITAANKVFDGDTDATPITGGAVFSGLVSGDVVTVAATGTFNNRNAGIGKTVTLTSTAGGADLNNYTVISQLSTTADITPASLIVSTADVSKTYDGTTSVIGGVPIVTVGTLFGSDALSGGSYVYANKNAGIGNKVVNVSGISVNDGNGGGNYSLSYANNTTSTINPASLTVSGITADNKVYDGGTGAAVHTNAAVFTGLISGDSLAMTTIGAFADRDAGIGKTVNLTSLYTGADAGNYLITSQATTTANISQAALTITANADARFVTQTDTAGYNGVHYSGFVGGDTATSLNTSGLAIARPNAGTDTAIGVYSGALVASGVTAGNYAISYAPGDYTILGANNALVKVVNLDTRYGNGAGYSVQSVQYMDGANVVSNLTLLSSSGNTFSYSDGAGGTLQFALAANSPVYSSSGNLAVGNYAIQDASPTIGGGNLSGSVTFTGNLAVQAAPVTVGTSGATKVYDGTAAITNLNLALNGLLSGDQVAISGSGGFAQKNVGSNLAFDIGNLQLSQADEANYYLASAANLSRNDGSITPKTLTVGGITADNKVYDGTSAATINTGSASLNGLVIGDVVTIAATGAFFDKNVGNAKLVNLVSTHGGADAGNYSFIDQDSTTADITPRALTLSGLSAPNKVYDGTTAASVDLSGAIYSGLISGDLVSAAITGAFGDKNVGVGKTVSLNTVFSGLDIGNYTISSPSTLTASITPKALLVSGIMAANKIYDGTTFATLDSTGAVFNGLISGDSLSLNASGSFADKNAGLGKTVNLSSSYGGADAGNYAITSQATTLADITPKSLSVSGLVATDKVYDGTTLATINTAGALFSGLISGDSLNLSATGAFSDKNVGTAKTVTLTSSLSGADAGNYAVTGQSTSQASITPKALSVIANDAIKVFNGLPYSGGNGVSYVGFVAGDDAANALTGNLGYSGTAQGAITLGNYTITPLGLSALNYTISFVDGHLAIVPAVNVLPPLLGSSAGGSAGGPRGTVNGWALGISPAAGNGNARLTVELTRLPDNTLDGFVSIKVPYDLATSGVGFNVTLPAEVLGGEQESQDAQASLLDGRPLPAWMQFAANSRVLSASAVPDAALPLQMLLTAKGVRTVLVVTELPRP